MEASEGEQVDTESVKRVPSRRVIKEKKWTDMPAYFEAAALLLVWSVLVVNEGTIRFVNSNPSVNLTLGGRPPKMIVFLGGLFEVVFGLIGVFLGIGALVFRWYNTRVTKFSMFIHMLLGYYVFIVYVFVVPIFRAIDVDETFLEGLSVGESKFLITLGILTSFHFCLALQGGQYIFFARLVAAATGTDFLRQNSGCRIRAIFWNGNMAFAGLWTLITGALVNASVGSGTIDRPFISPPNVGRLPGLTIFTGLLMIVWSLLAIWVVIARWDMPKLYYRATGVVYLFVFLNFTLAQFGVINRAPSASAAMHAGLVFAVVFLGPYFVYLCGKEEEGSALVY